MKEIMIFLSGVVLTTIFILFFFTLECKKCGKWKPLIEILRISKLRKLIAQICEKCQAKKKQREIEIF